MNKKYFKKFTKLSGCLTKPIINNYKEKCCYLLYLVKYLLNNVFQYPAVHPLQPIV